MTTPYRNEIDALRGRKAALEQEVADVDGLIEESERRAKRMLDVIQVASPCSASWDDMLGDDRTRHCLSCEKNVYNLTALTRDEAERFLQERATGEVCVRYYQRADGTIMTSDCTVGVTRKRRRKLAIAVAGFGAMALGAAASIRERTVMGKMEHSPVEEAVQLAAPFAVPPVATPQADPVVPVVNPPPNVPEQGHWTAGRMVRPVLRPVPKAPPPTGQPTAKK